MVAHICNTSTEDTEAQGPKIKAKQKNLNYWSEAFLKYNLFISKIIMSEISSHLCLKLVSCINIYIYIIFMYLLYFIKYYYLILSFETFDYKVSFAVNSTIVCMIIK
jgi:hypothetical protein